jgi:hypothetical protein
MLFKEGGRRGEPERPNESLGEQRFPIRRKTLGSKKGNGF